MRMVSLLPLAAALALAACSSPSAPDGGHSAATSGVPASTATTPADLTLGSPGWYAWVDRSLGITDAQGHGPDPGSVEWDRAVQRKLGQEAPQSKLGSPQWQQAVDSLLRARLPSAAATH